MLINQIFGFSFNSVLRSPECTLAVEKLTILGIALPLNAVIANISSVSLRCMYHLMHHGKYLYSSLGDVRKLVAHSNVPTIFDDTFINFDKVIEVKSFCLFWTELFHHAFVFPSLVFCILYMFLKNELFRNPLTMSSLMIIYMLHRICIIIFSDECLISDPWSLGQGEHC